MGGFELILILFGFATVGVLFVWLVRDSHPASSDAPGYDVLPHGPRYQLGVLTLAFDATARAALQSALDRIAQDVDVSAPDGLSRIANLTSAALEPRVASARVAYAHVRAIDGLEATQKAFERIVARERGRFEVATVRRTSTGVVRQEAPASTPRSEEGQGFVVVTVVVARIRNSRSVPVGAETLRDGTSVTTMFRAQLGTPSEIEALEVVWVPSDPSDVMSSAEMTVVFPEMPLDPCDDTIGRVRCTYCRAIYAAELGRCPSCGAGDRTKVEPEPRAETQTASDVQVNPAEPPRPADTLPCTFCGIAIPAYETQCSHCGGRAAK